MGQPKEWGEDQNFDEGTEVNLTVTKEDGRVKVLVMYSSDLQDLKAALECVHTFVEELGKGYSCYVSDTAKALLPVFDFSMAEEIRDLAFETWGELCGSARDAGQLQVVSELVMEFLKRMLPKFDETDFDVLAQRTRADGITTCLKKGGAGILNAEQVRNISQLCMKAMGESLARRAESVKEKELKKQANTDADDDGAEEDDDQWTEEQAFRIALQEIAGALMQHHPDLFVAEAFPAYLELVIKLMQANACEDDRKLAMFFICDFLEHLAGRITAQWPQFMPQVLADILHAEASIRQPACYGISLAAKEPAFAQLATDAVAKLSEVITQSRSRAKKKSEKMAQACADNAVSALVEILLNHQAVLSGAGGYPGGPSAQAQLWGVWLAALPCQEDEQEGVKNHKILLKLVSQQKPEIVGEGGANLPRILGIFVDMYKTEMADEETSKGIGQLLLSVGEARLEQYATQFSQKQRKKLQRIAREAQQ